VALERQRQLFRRHARAVVGHAHERGAAVAQVHRDGAGARVERVLHQLLRAEAGRSTTSPAAILFTR